MLKKTQEERQRLNDELEILEEKAKKTYPRGDEV